MGYIFERLSVDNRFYVMQQFEGHFSAQNYYVNVRVPYSTQ